MSKITKELHDSIEDMKLKRYYEEPICMRPVSKNLRGKFDVCKQERQECHEPECITLKARINFETAVLPHQPCDSPASQALNGQIDGRLVFAYIDNGMGRGYHVGRFEWQGSQSVAIGKMHGVTNAGTHRRPIDNCENCHEPGHMEGCIEAVIVKGKHKGCRICATYVINFDPGQGAQDTAFVGTIEGVLICDCKDYCD
ncbi:MAG: hypothetical protein ACR2RA_20115 [Geminicoccaceae bacterium]